MRERKGVFHITNGSTEAEEMKTYLIKEIETMIFFVIVLEWIFVNRKHWVPSISISSVSIHNFAADAKSIKAQTCTCKEPYILKPYPGHKTLASP